MAIDKCDSKCSCAIFTSILEIDILEIASKIVEANRMSEMNPLYPFREDISRQN